MRFMSLVKGPETKRTPPPALMQAIDGLLQEGTQSGFRMIDTGGLAASGEGGVRVRIDAGKLAVIDGPFTEAKEVVGGYAIFDVPSREDAVRWTERFMALHKEHWPGWDGECELRQIFSPADIGCAAPR